MRAQLTWALNAMNSAMEGVPLQYAQPQPQPAVGAGYAYAGAAGVWLSLSLASMHALVHGQLQKPALEARSSHLVSEGHAA